MSWDSLRRQTRTLENTLDAQIGEYAKLGTKVANGYSSTGKLSETTVAESREVESQVEEGLKQLASLVEQMQRLLETTTNPPPSTSMHHTATRHREILADYERDFKRTKASLREAEQRASLLSSVRSEISSFKSSQNQQNRSAEDQLLSERGHIDSSHRLADDVLGQAYETRYEFQRQRGVLAGSQSRMAQTLASIPGINSVVGMINSRRRRDTIILSSVVGVCTLLLLMVMFR